MNSTVKTYGQEYIFGSAAYDLADADFVERLPLESETEVSAPPAAEESADVGVVRATAARASQAIAPFSIIGFACAAVLMVFMLMSYIRLTQISEQSVELERRLSELEVEQTRLLIDYESAFNMTEIEEYATNILGMQKPRSDQVFYVDGSAPDRAEIIQDETQTGAAAGALSELLGLLGEYFG